MPNDLFAWVDEGNPIQDPRVEDDPFERAALARARGITIRPRTIPLATGLGNAVTVGNKLVTDPAVRSDLVNKLTGSGGEERMTTWPERMVRGVVGLTKDVSSGDFGTVKPDEAGMVSDEAIGERRAKDAQEVQDLSNFVIGGSLPMVAARGVERGVLGSGIVPKTAPSVAEARAFAIEQYNAGKDPMRGGSAFDQLSQDAQAEYMRRAYDQLEKKAARKQEELRKNPPAPIFYSGVENALEHSTQALATPDQWLGTLKNAKGVKPEEMQWLGLEDFLNEKKAKGEKVSRAELQDHVNQHKVEIKEVKKKGEEVPDDWIDETASEHLATWEDSELSMGRQPSQKRLDKEFETIKADINITPYDYGWEAEEGVGGGTKYGQYQLPGGKDYGELLLTLPHRREQVGVNTEGDLAGVPFTQRYRGGQKSGADYQSSHWDEPNVLAHVRYNTRDIDGKKTLHLEEIQSDWHQQGKKKGYKDNEQIKDKDKLEQEREALRRYTAEISRQALRQGKSQYDDPVFNEKLARIKEIDAKLQDQTPYTGAVPDAPFKKSWPELAFKRMLRHAAENGYDAVSWTPGEAQAARYALDKHIDTIGYQKRGDNYNITIWGKDGSRIYQNQSATFADLEKNVGKEMAEKIKGGLGSNNQQNGLNYIEGADLKLEQPGMRRFYDDQLVAIANKYAKAHGGKVEKKSLNNTLSIEEVPANNPKLGSYYYVDDPANPDFGDKMFDTRKEAEDFVKQHSPDVHYLELPSSLRDTALRKGFPLFSHGMMLTPVDGNPFEDKRKGQSK